MTPQEEIDAWIAADAQWVDANLDLLTAAYRYFFDHGEWPTPEQMIQRRARFGIVDDEPMRVMESRPLIPGQGPALRPERIVLSVRHLVRIPEAQPLLNLIARATGFALILLTTGDDPPRLTREQMIMQPPRLTPGTIPLLTRFLALMAGEHPRPYAGTSDIEGDWSMDVNVVSAVNFAGVEIISDFVRCQQSVIHDNLVRSRPNDSSARGEDANENEPKAASVTSGHVARGSATRFTRSGTTNVWQEPSDPAV